MYQYYSLIRDYQYLNLEMDQGLFEYLKVFNIEADIRYETMGQNVTYHIIIIRTNQALCLDITIYINMSILRQETIFLHGILRHIKIF